MRFLVVCIGALLAGCSSAPIAEEVHEEEAPPVVTRPDDYGYNTTQAHMHDYWDGADEIEVFSASRGMGAVTSSSHEDFPFRGETDQIIPQGTRWVNVTTSWDLSEPAVHGDFELWIRTARETEPFFVGKLERDQTMTFGSSNAHNDMPHQRLSAWQFIVRVEAQQGFVLLQGGLDMTVTASRGLEIPLYPGHPDRWKGQTEMDLVSYDSSMGVNIGPVEPGSGVRLGRACLFECMDILRPHDGSVVPVDAAAVVVELTAPAQGPRLAAAFHGADSLEWQTPQPDEDSEKRVYRIPVDGRVDGPYALQSLWEFQVYIEEPVEGGAWAGTYSVKATVVK